MSTLVLFPGLGASEKLFDRYNFGKRKVIVINFSVPEKNETLKEYSRRIAKDIPQNEELIFIGVSFGGILAQEISGFISVQKIFLISSIKSPDEMPVYFKWAKVFPWMLSLPPSWLKNAGVMLSEVFTSRSKEELKIFNAFVQGANPDVISFGIRQTLQWQPEKQHPDIIHIHGSHDLVFPIRNIKADYIIPNGSHFMIIQRYKEINRVINMLIDKPA